MSEPTITHNRCLKCGTVTPEAEWWAATWCPACHYPVAIAEHHEEALHE